MQRTKECAAQVAGALKSARIASDTAYRNLVHRVSALWMVQYKETYDGIINYVNDGIKHYKQEVITPKKKNNSTKE